MSTKAIILGTSLVCGIGSSVFLNTIIIPYNYKNYIYSKTINDAYKETVENKTQTKIEDYRIYIILKN